MKFLVRYPDGYALRFEERLAHAAADGEATLFDSPVEATAAVLRCGAGRRGLQIVSVNGEGKPIELV